MEFWTFTNTHKLLKYNLQFTYNLLTYILMYVIVNTALQHMHLYKKQSIS